MSAKTQNVLMLIKISMILMLIAALFMPSIHYNGPIDTSAQPVGFMDAVKAFGVALIAVSFTYGVISKQSILETRLISRRKIFPAAFFGHCYYYFTLPACKSRLL